MTLQSRAITPRQSSSSAPAPGNGRRLLAIYRAQMSSLIELERELVDQGLIRPEDRRIISREERRAGNGRDPIMRAANGRD